MPTLVRANRHQGADANSTNDISQALMLFAACYFRRETVPVNIVDFVVASYSWLPWQPAATDTIHFYLSGNHTHKNSRRSS